MCRYARLKYMTVCLPCQGTLPVRKFQYYLRFCNAFRDSGPGETDSSAPFAIALGYAKMVAVRLSVWNRPDRAGVMERV